MIPTLLPMRQYLFTLLCIFFSLTATYGQEKEEDRYSFINEQYPPFTFNPLLFKSDWGIFLLNKPYRIDAYICDKIKPAEVTATADSSQPALKQLQMNPATPREVMEQLYQKCLDLDSVWQKNFTWQQDKIPGYLLVTGTKAKITSAAVNKLRLTAKERNKALKCIREWNSALPGNRLVNYCSIPVFSDDGQYVLIVMGQDVDNEGGWDSIFIFGKRNGKWEKRDEIRIAEI